MLKSNRIAGFVAAMALSMTMFSCATDADSSSASVKVTKIEVTGTAAVKVGGNVQLTAAITPSNASDKSVTWTSSDTTKATVDASGKVTAVAAGESTITAKAKDGSNVSGTFKVTVTTTDVVSVTGVTLDKTTASVAAGSTVTLTATVAPANAANKNVTWTSSDTSVATVSAAGVVTGVKAGSAKITVKTADGSKTAECTVTVTAASTSTVAVTGVTLDKTTASLSAGGSLTLTATIAPANATNKNVTWTSSDTSVATVSAAGVITTLKAGSTKITVKTADGSKTAECALTVTAANYASLIIGTWYYVNTSDGSKYEYTFNTDKSYTYKCIISGTNNWQKGNYTIDSSNKITFTPSKRSSDGGTTWTDIDSSIASLLATNLTISSATATEINFGSFTVKKGTLPADKAVTKITISGDSSVTVNGKITLSAAITPTDATNQTVTWTSSDTAKATVSEAGVVTGVATGEATITAKAKDGSNVSGTYKVTVVADNSSVKIKVSVEDTDGKVSPSNLEEKVSDLKSGLDAYKASGYDYEIHKDSKTGAIIALAAMKEGDTVYVVLKAGSEQITVQKTTDGTTAASYKTTISSLKLELSALTATSYDYKLYSDSAKKTEIKIENVKAGNTVYIVATKRT